jgi:predicted transcriptional regulator of viral defense system
MKSRLSVQKLLYLQPINKVSMDILKQFSIVPIESSTLITVLGDYKSPRDKIMRMEESGSLMRLKKGLFVVTPKVHGQPLSTELRKGTMRYDYSYKGD